MGVGRISPTPYDSNQPNKPSTMTNTQNITISVLDLVPGDRLMGWEVSDVCLTSNYVTVWLNGYNSMVRFSREYMVEVYRGL